MEQDYSEGYWECPYDESEDSDNFEEILRNVRREAITIMSAIIDDMPDCTAKWHWAFALATSNCAGRNMSEIAARLGVTRADISVGSKSVCKRFNFPPSPYMRQEKAEEVETKVERRRN